MRSPLKDRYHLVERLSSTDRGSLYLVEDQASGTCRILKELVPAACLDDNDLAARHRQLNAALPMVTAVQHPNLARIHDHFYQDRRTYVVMEHVWGDPLDQVLRSVTVTTHQVLEWAAQVCRALHALHDRPRPYIFTALEPGHVMVTREGHIKLVGFGLSRFYAAEQPQLGLADEYLDLANLLSEMGTGVAGLATFPSWEELVSELRSGRPAHDLAELARRLAGLEPEPNKMLRRERAAPWIRLTRNLWAGLRTS